MSNLFIEYPRVKEDFLFCIGVFKERNLKELITFNENINVVERIIQKISRECSESTAAHNLLFTLYQDVCGTDVLLENNIKCC